MNAVTEEKLFSCAIRSALDADQLRERLDLALAACAEYREKLADLESDADTRRLDYLQAIETHRIEAEGLYVADDRVPFLVLARDGFTAWGATFREAVDEAMKHDAAMQQEAAP